jgi:bifunctional non-homologous end joining protein LigD
MEKPKPLPKSAKRNGEAKTASKGSSTADRFGIAISNADRLIYPDDRLTKGDLADYYSAMAGLMLADMARRPISLVRCPDGTAKKCFFQKHDTGSFGEHVKHVPIKESGGKTEDYIYVENGAGILACVQMGTIEFHGWGSMVGKIEHPDRLVFDLDPDEGLAFTKVREAAKRVRDALAELRLKSFPMLTGGKGIHVVVPLDASAGWDRVKDFAERFTRAAAEVDPGRFTANVRKEQRKGRIFLDWLRNQRGATAVMPYSARARDGAPVAAPVSWDELGKFRSGAAFSIRDADRLLNRASSKLLAGWGQAKQRLPKA